MKTKKDFKWGTIVPLIGGMTIGNSRAIGQAPDFFVSYPTFESHDSHAKNHFKETPFFLLDETANDFKTESDADYFKAFGDIDMISTVCPCAGLSSLNVKADAEAAQNDWMYKTAEFVLEKLNPRVFWGENAPALFTQKGTKVKNNLIEIGKKYGYTFSIVKTNSLKHGIPQKRVRSFYFFWRDTNPPIFTEINKESKTLKDFIKDIPESASMQDVYANNDYSTNGYIKWIADNPDVFETFRNSEKVHGRKMKSLFHYMTFENHFDKLRNYFKEHEMERFVKSVDHIETKVKAGKNIWDNTPKLHLYVQDYINAIQGRIFSYTLHPSESRYLNIREFMHLMGLPHDFELAHTKNFNHICQNVPVNTAADWTSEIIDYLKGGKHLHTDIYFEFNNTSDMDEDCSNSCSVKLF